MPHQPIMAIYKLQGTRPSVQYYPHFQEYSLLSTVIICSKGISNLQGSPQCLNLSFLVELVVPRGISLTSAGIVRQAIRGLAAAAATETPSHTDLHQSTAMDNRSQNTRLVTLVLFFLSGCLPNILPALSAITFLEHR